jgi:hypothetical protein
MRSFVIEPLALAYMSEPNSRVFCGAQAICHTFSSLQAVRLQV